MIRSPVSGLARAESVNGAGANGATTVDDGTHSFRVISRSLNSSRIVTALVNPYSRYS